MILNELVRDIIAQSTPREIVRRLADKFVDDHGDNIIADKKIDQDGLKKLKKFFAKAVEAAGITNDERASFAKNVDNALRSESSKTER